MLRYKTETRPGLVALYDIRPGNGAGQFLQPRSPHGARENMYVPWKKYCNIMITCYLKRLNTSNSTDKYIREMSVGRIVQNTTVEAELNAEHRVSVSNSNICGAICSQRLLDHDSQRYTYVVLTKNFYTLRAWSRIEQDSPVIST